MYKDAICTEMQIINKKEYEYKIYDIEIKSKEQ